MKILKDIEPKYTGTYLIRIGTFYWLPSITNPHNAYEIAHVKGVYKFDHVIIEAEDESEEEIFTALELYNDQVITSIEKL